MALSAVDWTSPLDAVILARMIQVTERNLAERGLLAENNRFRLRLLKAGNMGKAETGIRCHGLRRNIEPRDESDRSYRDKQERDFHVRFVTS